jgi:caffeoyl-CoA O-methyltransferase
VTTASVRSPFVDPTVAEYAAAHTREPDEVQRRLRATTDERFADWSGMQIGDDQAVVLELLTRAMGVQQAVEVGTFTGTSSLAIARGLPPGGRLLCCDVSEEWTAVARQAWADAGVADRVELRIAPALETLRALPEDLSIDLAFLDADKTGYAEYYAEIVPRLRPGGVLVVDNTLQRGRVADPTADEENVVAIRAFNDMVMADASVISTLLPIGDGLTLVQKST